MRYALVLGRVLFSLIFIATGYSHFQPASVAYAASQGVPAILVYASGLLACAGGLMIALGYKARLGGLFIALFLVPTTLIFHDFWNVGDPMTRMDQQAHFMKNLSMLGGALMVSFFGAGPLSLDSKKVPRELEERRYERIETETYVT